MENHAGSDKIPGHARICKLWLIPIQISVPLIGGREPGALDLYVAFMQGGKVSYMPPFEYFKYTSIHKCFTLYLSWLGWSNSPMLFAYIPLSLSPYRFCFDWLAWLLRGERQKAEQRAKLHRVQLLLRFAGQRLEKTFVVIRRHTRHVAHTSSLAHVS